MSAVKRRRSNDLDALEDHIVNGYPAVALQQRPHPPEPSASAEDTVTRVLDIQQVPLTPPAARQVSVLISDESRLAMGLVGHLVGLRACDDADAGFKDQVIELTETGVYQRGQRKWFACPGLNSTCGSRRMKLYLPPGEETFACSDCHGLEIPHAPDRPLRWRGARMRQETLHWHEPIEIQDAKTA